MSTPCLPPDILDHIVDLLHDNPKALKECCLVSKSWIPCTRSHIFADIGFYTKAELEIWKWAFPGSSTSPAHYAKTLHVSCLHAVKLADVRVGGWIRGFSCVANLEFDTLSSLDEWNIVLVPFYGFSPTIKTLRVVFARLPPSPIFNLILSFPLLEDLALIGGDTSIDGSGPDGMVTAFRPSKLPAFTGSLELTLSGGTRLIVRQLLSLPGGVHFRKLVLMCHCEEEYLLAMALVEKCSHTLESLGITCSFGGRHIHSTSTSAPTIYSCFQMSRGHFLSISRRYRHSKIMLITIFGLGELVPGWAAFKLQDRVAHVEYRFNKVPPKWDGIPKGENNWSAVAYWSHPPGAA